MFVARSLHRRSWKALSSLLPANSSKRCVLFDGNSENAIKTELLRSDSILAPSKLPFNYLIGSRSMSSVRGRSMRSRVEKRMQKESGRTLTEIRRAKTLRKKLMTEEERLIFNLRRAKKKVALLLQKLKKYELPELPPPRHDPELLTPEQFQAFKKIGFRNKNYVPVGVRGVFGGVVQNMHMHWKFHETVQVCCDNFPKEKIKEMASMLARLSGGIVINIHNVKTIIMFRGRNYRQPKNLIPINTLTKRKALFKARFEQALDSQKLNIKKYEQELRRKGVNPEDPVAMASIQRVASTFFNAIDKKDGSPYVFHGNNEQTESTSNFLKHPEPGDDSDQEELDKFIADIEDAADKEWAEEEAAEKEEFGRMRYLNREHSGGKYRKFDMRSGEDSGDDNRDAGFQRDQRGRQMSNRHITSDSEEADDEDDVEGDSNDVRNESDSESDLDYSTSAPHKFKKSMAGRADRRELRDVKAKETLAEEDSGTEDILSDLEDAMWKSDSEQEQEPVRLKVGNYEYRSDDDDDEEGDANETKRDKYRKSRQPEEQRGRGKHSDRTEINSHSFKDTNRKPRRAKNSRHREDNVAGDLWRTPKQYDNSVGNSSDSDIAMWESDDQEDLKVPKETIHSHQSTREENERLKGDEKASKEKTTRKQADEAWESD
ncbi:unnamed protein product [Rhodiola kirilowii]